MEFEFNNYYQNYSTVTNILYFVTLNTSYVEYYVFFFFFISSLDRKTINNLDSSLTLSLKTNESEMNTRLTVNTGNINILRR